MAKKPTSPAPADDPILAEVQALRGQHAAILARLEHLVEQVGWLAEESGQLRSDVAALRTELSHVHGDLGSRAAEAIDALRSLAPLDRAPPRPLPAAPEPSDPAEHSELLAAIFGKPMRSARKGASKAARSKLSDKRASR